MSTEYVLPQEDLDTDFKKKYPPDRLGDEMNPNARVWKVFRDEATAHDAGLLDGWDKTLDILLIFSGLFSAVTTAFLVESYKLLQPDNDAYVANALHLLVTAQYNSSVLPPPPDLAAAPSSVSRAINALWFVSLFLTLGISLLCILAKQWLREYIARTTASSPNLREWARRRMRYFRGISSWYLAGYLSVLPVLLHLALFLFFAGLSGFLVVLDYSLGITMSVLTGALFFFYFSSMLAPLLWPECPASVPLVARINEAVSSIHLNVDLWNAIRRSMRSVRSILKPWADDSSSRSWSTWRPTLPQEVPPPTPSLTVTCTSFCGDFVQALLRLYNAITKGRSTYNNGLQSRDLELDAAALYWLIVITPHTDANLVGVHSLGALHPLDPLAAKLRSDLELFEVVTHAALEPRPSATEALRLMRSVILMQPQEWQWLKGDPRSLSELFEQSDLMLVLKKHDYPDCVLLYDWLSQYIHPPSYDFADWYGRPNLPYVKLVARNAELWRNAPTPTICSTAILCASTTSPHLALELLRLVAPRSFRVLDWRLIVTLDPQNNSCLLVDSRGEHSCDWLCALEKYSDQDFFSTSDRYIDNVTSDLIANILQAELRPTSTDAFFTPKFIKYLASPSYMSIIRDITCVRGALHLIPGFVDWIYGSIPQVLEFRALANLLEAVSKQPGGDTLVSSIARRFQMCIPNYHLLTLPARNMNININDENTILLLEQFLSPWQYPTYMSLWEMMRREDEWPCDGLEFDTVGMQMGTRLISTLCALKRRGRDVCTLVHAFCAPLTYKYLLKDTSGQMMQHVLELNPMLWRRLCREVNAVEHDPLTRTFQRMGRNILTTGPCTRCPGPGASAWGEDLQWRLQHGIFDAESPILDIHALFESSG